MLRLSLDTMRDVSRARGLVLRSRGRKPSSGYSGVTRRALRHKMGFGSRDDPIWVRCLPQILHTSSNCAHPRRHSSWLSARRSRRTCPCIISTHLCAFCGPFATRTCRTLRCRPRSGATVRRWLCARIARRTASVCSTWRECSRRSFSPATWSGTSHDAFVGDANGILTWGRSSHMAQTYDKVIEELQSR